MPFLGQDWRSPGEQWVKTTEGWERLRMWRLKLLENLNENVLARLLKLASMENMWRHSEVIGCTGSQPHVCILRATTKECKMQVSLAEAFRQLDMTGAVKDVRRFNYVCKVLEILVKEKLTNLSGTAQKAVFSIMEAAVLQVAKTQNDIAAVKQVLVETRLALIRGHHHHLGSSRLWAGHWDTLNRLQNTLNSVELRERKDDGAAKLSDLPDDCIRLILSRLTNHHDLVNTGLTEMRTFDLAQEVTFWRDLCLFHFDNQQLRSIVRKGETLENLDWKTIYKRLEKRYGMRDVFGEMLHLCRNCSALFWVRHGHPCLIPDLPPKSVPITPVMCIELFSV